jgi:homopolymeric O-antigen transport system permease protein
VSSTNRRLKEWDGSADAPRASSEETLALTAVDRTEALGTVLLMEAATSLAPARPEPHVIKPSSRRLRLGLSEVWRHRELLYFFAWRELKVRYKQAVLGISWAVLQPLAYMVVLTLVFGRLLNVYAVGPYALVALSGSVIWLFFANSVTLASGSLVGNAALLTKVYFPRLLAPLAPVFAALVDLALATCVLVIVMAAYGEYPSLQRAWTAIPFTMLAMGTAAGLGAWFAALNVKYRDIRYVVPFVLQLGLFGSGVFLSFDALGLAEPWATLIWLNPMLGAVEGFRWAMLGGVRPEVVQVLISTSSGAAILVAGLVYFKRVERLFADIV